jgi:hypothetical protein
MQPLTLSELDCSADETVPTLNTRCAHTMLAFWREWHTYVQVMHRHANNWHAPCAVRIVCTHEAVSVMQSSFEIAAAPHLPGVASHNAGMLLPGGDGSSQPRQIGPFLGKP